MRALRLVTALVLVAAVSVVFAPVASADQVRDGQYWLDTLDLPEAWEISRGAGVVVAVVDQGVRPEHPDLAGALVPGTSFDGPGRAVDPFYHGTTVAVVLAGRGHDGDSGTLGVAPEAMVMPVTTGSIVEGAFDGIRWAVDHGATVINVSGKSPSQGGVEGGFDEVLAYAEAHDVVVVAGAGNSDSVLVGNPARGRGVIAVSAVDATGTFRPDVSVQGPEVELAAPGVDIMVSQRKDGVLLPYTVSGTSFSGPMVAGTAALIRSRYPELNAASVVQRLITTATDAGPPGHDPQYGYGIVNPVAALTADVAPVADNPLGSAAESDATAPPVAQGPVESSVPEPISLGTVLGVLGGAAVLVGAVVLIVVLVVVRRRRTPARYPPPPGPWR